MQIFFQIRPTEAELKEMGPEFNKLWDTYFKDKVRQFNPNVIRVMTDVPLLARQAGHVTIYQQFTRSSH